MPLDWAATQGNLAEVLVGIGTRTGDPARWREALGLAEAALEVFEAAEALHHAAKARERHDAIRAKLMDDAPPDRWRRAGRVRCRCRSARTAPRAGGRIGQAGGGRRSAVGGVDPVRRRHALLRHPLDPPLGSAGPRGNSVAAGTAVRRRPPRHPACPPEHLAPRSRSAATTLSPPSSRAEFSRPANPGASAARVRPRPGRTRGFGRAGL
jgi:hypothetical protein